MTTVAEVDQLPVDVLMLQDVLLITERPVPPARRRLPLAPGEVCWCECPTPDPDPVHAVTGCRRCKRVIL